MIRRWSRGRFIAFSALVGIAAFFLSVAATDVARRRANAQETRRELVLAATTAHGQIAAYDTRADHALAALDTYVTRLQHRQLALMLALGVVAVFWAGVASAWLAGRRTPTNSPQ